MEHDNVCVAIRAFHTVCEADRLGFIHPVRTHKTPVHFFGQEIPLSGHACKRIPDDLYSADANTNAASIQTGAARRETTLAPAEAIDVDASGEVVAYEDEEQLLWTPINNSG